MGQALSINEASTLITDYLDATWEAETPPETTYDKVFETKPMNRGQHTDYRTAGLGPFVEHEELEDIDYDDIVFGEKLSVTDKKWARGFKVSEYVLEDLADAGGNADGELAAKIGTYGDIVRRWKRSANWTVERECADRLINGTSTAVNYVMRDGIALFGAHVTLKNPVVSQTNLSSHQALSANSVDSMATAMDLQLDDRGDYMDISGTLKLVVSATDASRAYEIIQTRGQVDSANNTVNRLNRRNIDVIEWRYLNLLAASYSGYFLLRGGAHSLRWLWRKKVRFAQDNDFDAIAKKYRANFRGVTYIKDWRGTMGDNGS